MVLAATWMTPGNISPAILYILGIINNKPWLAVKVDANEPLIKAPWKVPAAPASLCISINLTGLSNKFNLWWLNKSILDAIGLEGVIGYILDISLKKYAISLHALFPSHIFIRYHLFYYSMNLKKIYKNS